MVVIMSHVIGNALEWFPMRITQLHLVSCCTAVLDVLLYCRGSDCRQWFFLYMFIKHWFYTRIQGFSQSQVSIR